MKRMAMLLVVLVAGCASKGGDAETLVERLRLLAVQAEPPQATLEATVEFEALIVDPAGAGRPLSVTWAVCLFDVPSSASDTFCSGPGSYQFGGTGATATLSLPDLAAWVAQRGIDLNKIVGDPRLGDIYLLIGIEVSAGDETIQAMKRLSLQLKPGEPVNHNPQITGLEMDGALLDSQPVSLVAESKHEFRPLVSEDSREWFIPGDDEDEKLEDNLFSWYATGGDLSDGRTILDTDNDGNDLVINDWTAPNEPGPHSLWLVVRDGRYGIDWIEILFEVTIP
jgi:hypothetical protein